MKDIITGSDGLWGTHMRALLTATNVAAVYANKSEVFEILLVIYQACGKCLISACHRGHWCAHVGYRLSLRLPNGIEIDLCKSSNV